MCYTLQSRHNAFSFHAYPLFLVPKLLMNSSNLLLHINILHNLQPPWIPLLELHPIIAVHRGLLPPHQLLFGNHLSRRAIKKITSLTC
jgi:hypothetical protein